MWGALKFFVFQPQHLWVAWDKDSRHVLSGHIIPTGRKQVIQLLESRTANLPGSASPGEAARRSCSSLPENPQPERGHFTLKSFINAKRAHPTLQKAFVNTKLGPLHRGEYLLLRHPRKTPWIHQLSPMYVSCCFIYKSLNYFPEVHWFVWYPLWYEQFENFFLYKWKIEGSHVSKFIY